MLSTLFKLVMLFLYRKTESSEDKCACYFLLKNLMIEVFYSYPKERTSLMVRPLTEDVEICHMQKSSPLIVTKNIPRTFCSMCANEGLKILMPTAQNDDLWCLHDDTGPFLFLEISKRVSHSLTPTYILLSDCSRYTSFSNSQTLKSIQTGFSWN